MPIYEYQCDKCEKCFEQLVFAGDTEPVVCPQCGSTEVNKLMSCASFMGGSGDGLGSSCGTGTGFS